MRRFALALLAGLVPIGAVAAETSNPSCPYATLIIAAADVALRRPQEPPRFWRDRHGDSAAYLKIRYGGLDGPTAESLLTELEARQKPPERMVELRLSHAETTERAQGIASFDPSPRDGTVLTQLGGSVLRALVLEDGGDWLIGEARRWFDAQPDSPLRQTFVHGVARSIADADDAAKVAFAAKAEAAGLWSLAFRVNAVRDDLSGVIAVIDRAPKGALGDPGQDPAAWRSDLLRFALTLAELRDGFDMSKQPGEFQALDAPRPNAPHFRRMYRVASSTPEAIILLTVLNQTGELRLATELTPDLLDKIAKGEIDPVLRPAGLMTAMAEGFDAVLGRAVREGTLDSFDVSIGPTGTRPVKASAFLDRMVAREALVPVVTGDVASVERPALLTSAYAWDQAQKVAIALASKASIDPADHLLAIDLLVGAGRFDNAVKMLSDAPDVASAQPVAHALAEQLDRACLGVLAPALPLNESVFRFYPR